MWLVKGGCYVAARPSVSRSGPCSSGTDYSAATVEQRVKGDEAAAENHRFFWVVEWSTAGRLPPLNFTLLIGSRFSLTRCRRRPRGSGPPPPSSLSGNLPRFTPCWSSTGLHWVPFTLHLLSTHVRSRVQWHDYKNVAETRVDVDSSPVADRECFNHKTINLHKLDGHAWRSKAWCVHYYVKQLWVHLLLFSPTARILLSHLFSIQMKYQQWDERYLICFSSRSRQTWHGVKLHLMRRGGLFRNEWTLQTGKPVMLLGPLGQSGRHLDTWTVSLVTPGGLTAPRVQHSRVGRTSAWPNEAGWHFTTRGRSEPWGPGHTSPRWPGETEQQII